MVIMLIEMCIYLAYYKDVIFSIVTLTNYVGMYFNYENHGEKVYDYSVKRCIIAMISISSAFILMTIIHDYEKAFYMKYRLYYKKFE